MLIDIYNSSCVKHVVEGEGFRAASSFSILKWAPYLEEAHAFKRPLAQADEGTVCLWKLLLTCSIHRGLPSLLCSMANGVLAIGYMTL